MKNLILENWCMQDIPPGLERILETQFIENREYWTQFQSSWYPENRAETTRGFTELNTGDNIICETVFDGWQQLELISILLMKSEIKEGLNIYIRIGTGLEWQIQDYLEEMFSDIESGDLMNHGSNVERKDFKKEMNKIILGVLVKHNVYDLDRKNSTLLKVEDFDGTNS